MSCFWFQTCFSLWDIEFVWQYQAKELRLKFQATIYHSEANRFDLPPAFAFVPVRVYYRLACFSVLFSPH